MNGRESAPENSGPIAERLEHLLAMLWPGIEGNVKKHHCLAPVLVALTETGIAGPLVMVGAAAETTEGMKAAGEQLLRPVRAIGAVLAIEVYHAHVDDVTYFDQAVRHGGPLPASQQEGAGGAVLVHLIQPGRAEARLYPISEDRALMREPTQVSRDADPFFRWFGSEPEVAVRDVRRKRY